MYVNKHGIYLFQHLTYTFIRCFEEMLQKSYPPGIAILSMYIPVLTLPVIGESCTIALVMSCTYITHEQFMPYHSRTHHSGICIPYVQSMYIVCTCLYIVRTRMNHVCSTFIHATRNVACLCTDFSKNKKWHRSRFEPMILCILTSCLDRYTTSVLVKLVIVALYIDCFYL